MKTPVLPPAASGDPDDAIRALSEDTGRRNLALLIRLRWIALAGQALAIAVTVLYLGADLPVPEMMAVIGLSCAINLFALWRCCKGLAVSDWIVTVELLIDIAALTVLLYFSGGAANPFVTLFILQVMLGLLLAPMPQVIFILSAAAAAHFWLLRHGRPLRLPAMGPEQMTQMTGDGFFGLHLLGMFLSFVLAAGLLTWFVSGLRRNLAARDAQIAVLRQKLVEDEHFVRLGVMASSTAHDLGTPLTTLAVTLDEWHESGIPDSPRREKVLARMQQELARCRHIVSGMLFAAGLDRLDLAEALPAGEFLDEVITDWREDGGALEVEMRPAPVLGAALIADTMLEQALRNILTNAQQAGARHMTLSAHREAGHLVVVFDDDGPGFPQAVLDHPVRPMAAGKGDPGRGFGLYLVSNAVRRLGGDWSVENRAEGGARVRLSLPLKEDET
ncbi:ATP-binding protein [Thioclava sp. FTW29]|uniref:histidine kinase n=1 Tax=Thioclava litoralis TaxID=3076557 RepID=A0ABZ1E4R4_9RHOB|nr:ATP-binding protein [Thioclava sp. FTW29]